MTGGFKETKLKNGISVLFIKSKSNDSAMGISVSINENNNSSKPGLPHLVEHVIARSETESGADLRDAVYGAGGVFDAATTISHTYFYLYSLADDFINSSSTLVRGIFRPRFRPGVIEKSKDSVMSEMVGSPGFATYSVLKEMMWREKKMQLFPMGSKEDLLSLTADDVEEFHKNVYTSTGVSFVFVCSEYPSETVELIEGVSFHPLSDHETLVPVPKEPSYRIFEEGHLASSLTLAFPTVGYNNSGHSKYAFRLAASLLSDTYVSELEKSGLIYHNSWIWNTLPASGEFILELPDILSEHTVSVIKTAVALFDNWQDLPVSSKSFENAKKQRILSLRLSNSLDELLPLVTKEYSMAGDARTIEDAIRIYEEMSLREVLSAGREVVLTGKPFLVTNMGDNSSKYTSEIRDFLEGYYNN